MHLFCAIETHLSARMHEADFDSLLFILQVFQNKIR
jgi:hypothetical protein